MKELFTNSKKHFTSYNSVYTICRRDYESMGDPMCAIEFSDNKMQKLADAIGSQLANEFTNDEIETWSLYDAGEYDGLTNRQIQKCDLFDERAFEIMEETAISMGMRYYEDMNEEEYNEIINQLN